MFHVEHGDTLTGYRLVVLSAFVSTRLDAASRVGMPERLENRQNESLGRAFTTRTNPASGGWSVAPAANNRSLAQPRLGREKRKTPRHKPQGRVRERKETEEPSAQARKRRASAARPIRLVPSKGNVDEASGVLAATLVKVNFTSS